MTKHEQISRLFMSKNLIPKKSWPEYHGGADWEWIVRSSGMPWLKLEVDIPVEEILREILIAKDLLVNHRDDYGEHRGWQSFCIHGKALEQTAYCDDVRPWRWIPESVSAMPKTTEFFQNWPGGFYERLRVMALQPGGYVSLHQDPGIDGLQPINIAITQPQNCRFVMENWGEIPFYPGSAFLLNIHRNKHVVFNDSDQTRYHIIIHHKNWTAGFRSLIEQSYHSQSRING